MRAQSLRAVPPSTVVRRRLVAVSLAWLALSVALPGTASAQGAAQPATQASQMDAPQHERTAPIVDARFELVQSSVAARLTLRFDRISGIASQLMIRPDSSFAWQPIFRLPHVEPDTRVSGRPNYQLFTSGLGMTYTFMLNVHTGATWQLKEDPARGWFWDAIIP
jgi:hypothetical protein